MRTQEIGDRRTLDTRCRACGNDVEALRFFDTRGHHYCAPECWEVVGDPRPQNSGGVELR
jgi:hypothetical protein